MLAERLDVALDFGWSSASALHNWRIFINGFTGCGKTQGSYQGIALAIPQALRNQTPL
jgi:hypothetical protein